MEYKWPLNVSNFTFSDRLKIGKFYLNPKNRWTQGEQVRKYEEAWQKYTKAKYVVMTSSGSTANTLIAMYAKDTNKSGKNIVVFPSTTWQTSISPWIREGFEPAFIDVNLKDLSIDLDKLESYLAINSDKVHTVFITSLIGYTPDIQRLYNICQKYNVWLKMDNCENSFGSYKLNGENYHICANFTCSTSNYFGHQTTNGGESGLIFCNNEDEYIYYLMNRSHGMTRALLPYLDKINPSKYDELRNLNVDWQFDFATLGNNYRNTDAGAFIGLLDFTRIPQYIERRNFFSKVFFNAINREKYFVPDGSGNTDVGFCLPIITKNFPDDGLLEKVISLCLGESVEFRPIVSGFLGYQTCYKKYFDGKHKDYPNSRYLHFNGIYIGLHPKISGRKLMEFTQKLNKL